MEIPAEVVATVYQLLPGFLAAWVFYGLTAHPRLSPFERVVQALIFTALVRAIGILVHAVLVGIGRRYAIGTWTSDVELIWSLGIAVLLGLAVSHWANNDTLHEILRKWKITSRTSYPSEWFSAFQRRKHWCVFHLDGPRRLYGFPAEWPDDPTRGHFVIEYPEWLDEKNVPTRFPPGATVILSVAQVLMIETVPQKNDEGGTGGSETSAIARPSAAEAADRSQHTASSPEAA